VFTREQFFDVFWQYHEAVWPAQVVLACLAIAIVVLLLRLRPWSGIAVRRC
jgi:hypothetical protein